MPDVQLPDDQLSNRSAIRIEELLAADDAAPESSPPAREGLPRSFRMRADKHYVEMLDTSPQRQTRRGVPDVIAPAPANTREKSVAPAGAERQQALDEFDQAGMAAAVKATSELAHSLAAVRASTTLLTERGAPLAAGVAANLIRAEIWRATCLLHAARFLRGEWVTSLKDVAARRVIEDLLSSIEPERRLRHVTLNTRVNVGDSTIAADEQLLGTALAGLLMWAIALSGDGSNPVVDVPAERQAVELVVAIVHNGRETARSIHDGPLGYSAARIIAALGGTLTTGAVGEAVSIRVAFRLTASPIAAR